jgi:hypothetical protein
MSPQKLAWLVTLICMVLSARFAVAFLRDSPRLFTVMALFACVWAHILGFYGLHLDNINQADLATWGENAVTKPAAVEIKQLASDLQRLTDFITNIAGFLLIYIGALLMLEAREGKQLHPRRATVPLQSFALVMLLLIALPRALSIPSPDGDSPGLTQSQVNVIVSIVVDVLACVSIVAGAWAISGGPVFALLALVMGVYGTVLVMQDLNRWESIEYFHMSNFYLYSFSGLKLACTLLLGCIVSSHGMTSEMRKKGFSHWVAHFFYLA